MATGSYADRIRAARPRLSKSFQRLADYILDSYVQAALMTASELAHQVDVDSATVVRFAQALDYSGFPELQDEIKARVIQELLLRPKESAEPDSLPAVADKSFKELSEALDRKRRMMDTGPLEAVLKAVRNRGAGDIDPITAFFDCIIYRRDERVAVGIGGFALAGIDFDTFVSGI